MLKTEMEMERVRTSETSSIPIRIPGATFQKTAPFKSKSLYELTAHTFHWNWPSSSGEERHAVRRISVLCTHFCEKKAHRVSLQLFLPFSCCSMALPLFIFADLHFAYFTYEFYWQTLLKTCSLSMFLEPVYVTLMVALWGWITSDNPNWQRVIKVVGHILLLVSQNN
jgi:hypothetical protein